METILNKRLVEQQELTDGDCDELERLHDQRERVFVTMEDLDPENHADKDMIILLSELLESLEYNMQRVWKFNQTSTMHSWWYKVPHCECPTMDNMDMQGTCHRAYNLGCPVHGHLFEQHTGETYEITPANIKEL